MQVTKNWRKESKPEKWSILSISSIPENCPKNGQILCNNLYKLCVYTFVYTPPINWERAIECCIRTQLSFQLFESFSWHLGSELCSLFPFFLTHSPTIPPMSVMVGSGNEEKGSVPDCLSARLNLQISWLTQLLCWMSPHGVPWLCVCQPPVYPEPGSEPLLTHLRVMAKVFPLWKA